MEKWPKRPTDQRRERQRLERRLVISAVILFLVAGGTLIGLIYGWEAVFTGLLCLVPGLVGLVLIWGLLRLLEHFTDRWD